MTTGAHPPAAAARRPPRARWRLTRLRRMATDALAQGG